MKKSIITSGGSWLPAMTKNITGKPKSKPKQIIFIFLVFIFVTFKLNAQNKIQPKSLNRPTDFEYLSAPDSNGVRTPLKIPLIVKSSSNLKLPYPIIFIHGLIGDSSTWNEFTDFLDDNYGFTYGGRMDYCLNYDGNNTTANTIFAPLPNADLAWWGSNLIVGDYFYLNFDVGTDGSFHPNGNKYDCWSNQQAIVKQGVAVKWAIYDVLEKTGCDKVILMGHSMGGLSAREYIQNPELWQSDGKHHVAKLVTAGTPHGGSNSTAFGIGLTQVNEKMDATRDLRRNYAISFEPGVYLFGGKENDNIMRNNFLFDYFNIDVNCNGIYDEKIKGLNQKEIPKDIDISCIVGNCPDCLLDATNLGDGIVSRYSANLKNFYELPYLNLFNAHGSSLGEIHTDLPDYIYENMQGLDEPNEFFYAYEIGLNNIYKGFACIQSEISPYYKDYDYDMFKFKLSATKKINVIVDDIKVSDLMIRVLDSSNKIVGSSKESNGNSKLNFQTELGAGDYFLEISATPPTSDYPFSYNFKIDSENYEYTDVSNLIADNNIIIYPNPTSDFFTIKFRNNGLTSTEYILNDQLGRVFNRGIIENESTTINISNLESGIYFLRIGSQMNQTFKIIKTKSINI